MSGNPAFQANAFQNSAFQTTILLSAPAYSLGGLQIAIPSLTVKRVLTVASYSLGSPSFATPALKSVYILTAPAAYSLGSPSFATPAVFSWTSIVAGDYSLGSPSFATPAMTYKVVFAKPADYSLGSPSFATPPVGIIGYAFHANAYSLGALTFGTPFVRFLQKFTPRGFSVGSPTFATPQLTQRHRFYVNAMAVGPLYFGTPAVRSNYQLTAPAYSLGALDIASNAVVLEITTLFRANSYSLGSPKFGFPRLQVELAPGPIWPPTYLTQVEQASAVLTNWLNLLLKSIPSTSGAASAEARRLINAMRANAPIAIRGDSLGTDLWAICQACFGAGSTYAGIEAARQYLMSQVASTSPFTQIVYRSALVMNLALESKIIAAIRFTTQADAQQMTIHAAKMFEDAKRIGIDEVDALVYQTLNRMGGALVNHLGRTQLQLPRYLTFKSDMPMPSLYLANRIYADPTRYREIEVENDVINPAFCPRTLRVLSNVGR